jgi:hypothetical protein
MKWQKTPNWTQHAYLIATTGLSQQNNNLAQDLVYGLRNQWQMH